MDGSGKRIVIGTDHGAVALKDRLRDYLRAAKFEVADLGVDTEESVDYPDTTDAVCRELISGDYEFGIVLCGTGIGASIAANKHAGIRCAVVHDLYTAEMARSHNDANLIAFGGRVTYGLPVESMVDRFIETKFLGGRHSRRIEKLSLLDQNL